MYWRFDEEEQYVELDYPRDLVMWRGIPYNIDAVFQWHDKKTYFFKEKYFWEFNDQRMQVSADSPKLIGELFLQCPKEILDPFKQAHSCVFTNTYALYIYNFFLLSFFQSYTFKK